MLVLLCAVAMTLGACSGSQELSNGKDVTEASCSELKSAHARHEFAEKWLAGEGVTSRTHSKVEIVASADRAAARLCRGASPDYKPNDSLKEAVLEDIPDLEG
jgi:hypothetical protein